MIAILLKAGLSRNGNARRVYVVLDEDGNVVGAHVDDGAGMHGLLKRFPRVKHQHSAEFVTTPAEYRALMKRDADTRKMMGARRPLATDSRDQAAPARLMKRFNV